MREGIEHYGFFTEPRDAVNHDNPGRDIRRR
jgi:hypothetical protein